MKRTLPLLLFIWLLLGCGGADAMPTPVAPATVPTRTFDPSGSLLFIQITAEGQQLVQLDTATGSTETLFSAPTPGLLTATAVSPIDNTILVAYSPPDDDGRQRGDTELYVLSPDGSDNLIPLITRQQSDERFLHPVFSPDGRFLYFNHLAPDEDGRFTTTLERLDLQSGTAEIIVQDGLMPALSPDGRSLAYIAVEPETQMRALVVAGADGANPRLLLGPGDLAALANPLFAPDGQAVYVSGAGASTAGSTQNPPADWWRVDVESGELRLLRPLQLADMGGAFSTDGRYLAFAGQAGVFLMHADGSGVLQLADVVAAGDVSWLPAPQ